MSHYFSTFLYEPIIRQARRFSNPGVAEPTESSGIYHGMGNIDFEDSETTEEQDRPMINSEAFPVFGEPVVHSPLAEDVPWDGVSGTLEHVSDTPSVVHRSYSTTATRNLSSPISSATVDASYVQSENGTIIRISPRLGERTSSTSSSVFNSRHDTDTAYRRGSERSRRNTAHDDMLPNPTSHVNNSGDGILPEDDGMGLMRKQILNIQKMDVSSTEKSRRMHELMIYQYSSIHGGSPLHHDVRAQSPRNLQYPDRPFTPSSGHSMSDTTQSSPLQTSVSSIADQDNTCRITADELLPTYYISPISSLICDEADFPMEQDNTADQDPPLGCRHYKRNVKLQCADCHHWYTCRFCHDEVEDHALNRRETKNMLCMLCGCPQPAAEECKDCGGRGGWYYCGVCKLWDDDPQKYIYHCNDCGICRIGKGLGKDFHHCKTCCVCVSIAVKDSHRCIERSTDCDCPICGDYMFNSPQTVVFMRCGHSIHLNCYNEHIKTSYRCPICSRSMMNMEMQFKHLDRSIESQPMPEQFRDTKAWVYCNDCSGKTEVKYHWLGLKCTVCDSYNTVQISITSVPRADSMTSSAQDVRSTRGTYEMDSILPEAVHAFVRGRTRLITNSMQRSTSTSVIDLPPRQTSQLQRRGARSTSARLTTREATAMCNAGSFGDERGENVEVLSDDDMDDIDFWGGESPREEHSLNVTRRVLAGSHDSDAGDSEDDEVMNDESDAVYDNDEDDEEDHMDLFGHR